MGVGELFRVVFADELGAHGRSGSRPAAFNLVTLAEPLGGLPLAADVDVGEFRLVGAGAIGQAAAHTLAVAGARGSIVAVDPEKVALSNLQRYVLTTDADVGAVKVDLLRDRLAASGLEVDPVPSEWHAGLVEAQRPTLVALDSAEARLGVQSSLPGPIYNAWTQPADVGWSRHERFGDEPCLACLYWPDHQSPSRHEQIAAAFRQHPLRVLAYLVHRAIPIGLTASEPLLVPRRDARRGHEPEGCQDLWRDLAQGNRDLRLPRPRRLFGLPRLLPHSWPGLTRSVHDLKLKLGLPRQRQQPDLHPNHVSRHRPPDAITDGCQAPFAASAMEKPGVTGVLRMVVVLTYPGHTEEGPVRLRVALDDQIPRPLVALDQRLHRRRGVLAGKRIDELDRRRPHVVVGEVEPNAGGHRRNHVGPQGHAAEEANVDLELAPAQQDPAAAAIRLLVLAPKPELPLKFDARDLGVDDSHRRT